MYKHEDKHLPTDIKCSCNLQMRQNGRVGYDVYLSDRYIVNRMSGALEVPRVSGQSVCCAWATTSLHYL